MQNQELFAEGVPMRTASRHATAALGASAPLPSMLVDQWSALQESRRVPFEAESDGDYGTAVQVNPAGMRVWFESEPA